MRSQHNRLNSSKKKALSAELAEAIGRPVKVVECFQVKIVRVARCGTVFLAITGVAGEVLPVEEYISLIRSRHGSPGRANLRILTAISTLAAFIIKPRIIRDDRFCLPWVVLLAADRRRTRLTV